jgi:hypothetical protein
LHEGDYYHRLPGQGNYLPRATIIGEEKLIKYKSILFNMLRNPGSHDHSRED